MGIGSTYSTNTDITKFEPVMDINFWGSVYPTHFAVPYLKSSHGKIIVNASSAGLFHPPNGGFYNASKAALISFYESLRYEVFPSVTITILTLGFIQTNFITAKNLANSVGLNLRKGGGWSWRNSSHLLCSSNKIKYSSSHLGPDPTKDFDTTKPDTNFVLTSGAIRGTLTQPRFSKKLIMSTHEQITNNPTSAVRNTGGRNGPQGLEEPMSDEVLREMCDKNYHQLLPLIAEKMQKEKEQKDKLNAVKARLIYGEESGVKIRSHEESHYSESKTPTARTEPRRRRGDRYSRSPSPHASVFKRLKRNRSPSPRPRSRKEGGVFNRLGRKEPATSARPDRRQQKGTPSRTTSQYSESEDSEGGGGVMWGGDGGRGGPEKGQIMQTTFRMMLSPGRVLVELRIPCYTEVSGTLVSRGLGCPATSKHMMEAEIRKTT
ncbi:11-beta-hydroxysteroid dehydrogenase-like protein 4A [Tanacetum coccineum]